MKPTGEAAIRQAVVNAADAGDAPMNQRGECLPANWEEIDSHRSYYDAVRAIGEQVKRGERELPEMFRMRDEYQKFLETKNPRNVERGLSSVPTLSGHLKPHQRICAEFALRSGGSGCYLDTGLGKSNIELETIAHGAEATNGYGLILCPLAVAGQMAREAARFGYNARVIRDQSEARPGINICNYDRLDKLDPAAFGAVALDEASILKSFSGVTTRKLIGAFGNTRFRLAATATPAPNDHMELGQQSEFLGIMPSNEMLMRWFINDQEEMGRYRLKNHAIVAFWDWMASWARMGEKPSDLGGDDTGYDLPALRVHRHRTKDHAKPFRDGLLGVKQLSATEMFSLKRQTAEARARLARDIIIQSLEVGAPCKTKENICVDIGRFIPKNGNLPTKSGNARTPGDGNDMRQIQNTGSATSQKSGTQQGARQRLIHGGLRINDCASNSVLNCKITSPCSDIKTERAQYAEHETPADTNHSTLTIATRQEGFAGCYASNATSVLGNSETTQKFCDSPLDTSREGSSISWVLWCDTNEEQDRLEDELGNLAFSIRGSLPAELKVSLHDRWLAGERPCLITKGLIFGYGMNWQHCSRMIFVGRSFSYEQYYQAVRRCWRYGQRSPVDVHLIVADGEDAIGRVIDRKADDHTTMRAAMADAMRRALGLSASIKVPYDPQHLSPLPTWIGPERPVSGSPTRR